MNKIFIFRPFLLLVIVLLGACTSIKTAPVYVQNDRALEGYDPVAYFVVGKALMGKEKTTYQYNGTTWFFNSEENKALFVRSPEKYSPQYGGYCAYAMSHGFTVSSDPQAFSVINDKLYLNYSKSVRAKWLKDSSGHIVSADKQWNKKSQ